MTSKSTWKAIRYFLAERSRLSLCQFHFAPQLIFSILCFTFWGIICNKHSQWPLNILHRMLFLKIKVFAHQIYLLGENSWCPSASVESFRFVDLAPSVFVSSISGTHPSPLHYSSLRILSVSLSFVFRIPLPHSPPCSRLSVSLEIHRFRHSHFHNHLHRTLFFDLNWRKRSNIKNKGVGNQLPTKKKQSKFSGRSVNI